MRKRTGRRSFLGLAEFEQKSGARVEVNFVQDAQLDAKVQTDVG